MNRIDGKQLKNMVLYAIHLLSKNRDELDSLNIFPVPDGDTGTNMSLTSLAAANEIEKLDDLATCDDVMKAASSGSLRGARGNSGVILSQLFRGLSRGFKDKTTVDTTEFAYAFKKSSEVAYKAVMKPREGTVLTVSRALAEKSAEIVPEVTDFEEFFDKVIEYAKIVLDDTPNMLPALKAAGVVDAGGLGLVYIVTGFKEGLTKEAPKISTEPRMTSTTATPIANINPSDIKFGYCTEFFIERPNFPESRLATFANFLEKNGDSVVSVSNEELVKIHVHTNHPGKILEAALQIGPLSNIKIDNMRIQHTSIINNAQNKLTTADPYVFVPAMDKTHKSIGIISVASGDGLKNIMLDLGADHIIAGGQSMNPSADDFVRATKTLNKQEFIFLPNNKNIVMAAKQAAEILEKEEGKKCLVLETKTIPQGIGAMIALVHEKSLDDTFEIMKQGADSISSAQITKAVRDTEIDGKTIKTGDFLGLIEDKIEVVKKSSVLCAKSIIDTFAEECEFISLFVGENANEDDTKKICDYIEENEIEYEKQYGGQAVYDYIISAE